jgi:glycerol transport system substrate-binding protein
MAKAFTEITGIKVKHDIIQEGDVVRRSDQAVGSQPAEDQRFRLIGTHFR